MMQRPLHCVGGGVPRVMRASKPADLHELRGAEQVPESMRKRVPGDFEVVAQRKGFLRFRNPELTELVAAHAEASQQKEACLASALQVRHSHSSA